MKKALLLTLVLLVFINLFALSASAKTIPEGDGSFEFGDRIFLEGDIDVCTYKFVVPYSGTVEFHLDCYGSKKTAYDVRYVFYIHDAKERYITGDRYDIEFKSTRHTGYTESIKTYLNPGTYCVTIGAFSLSLWAHTHPDWNLSITPRLKCSHYSTYTSIIRYPSCTTEGKQNKICNNCKDVLYTESIEKKPHTPLEEVTLQPTCSETGVLVTTCSVCKTELNTETIQKLPHVPNPEWTHLSDVSCKEEGKDSLFCSVCNQEIDTKITEKLPHNYGNWETKTEPSCSNEGEKIRICSECSYTEKCSIEKLEHTFGDFIVTKEATCTEEGSKECQCSVCGFKKITYLDKKPHNFNNWIITTNPTCTETGEQYRICTLCQTKEIKQLDKISHDLSNWATTTSPTCTAKGKKARSCKTCYYEEYEVVNQLGHQYNSWYTLKTPTEASKGEMRRDCIKCSNYETQSVPALVCGSKTKTITITNPTCQSTGKVNIVCSYCSKIIKTETLNKSEHVVAKWTIIQKATRTQKGTRAGNCKLCNYTITENYPWILPAKNGFVSKKSYTNHFTDVKSKDWFYSYIKTSYEYELINGVTPTEFKPTEKFTIAQALTVSMKIHSAYNDTQIPEIGSGAEWYKPYVEYCIEHDIIYRSQFKDYNKNITRGEMAIIFANILPSNEYSVKRTGALKDMKSSMSSYRAVIKLFHAGIIGGYEDGTFRPDNEISRSEASAIFTRIVVESQRTK